jgi:hypothetical protein
MGTEWLSRTQGRAARQLRPRLRRAWEWHRRLVGNGCKPGNERRSTLDLGDRDQARQWRQCSQWFPLYHPTALFSTRAYALPSRGGNQTEQREGLWIAVARPLTALTPLTRAGYPTLFLLSFFCHPDRVTVSCPLPLFALPALGRP